LWVENRSDELWIGVKGQSNWEIAGSLRNIFRYGLGRLSAGGRALQGRGGFTAYQLLANSEYLTDGPRETGAVR
jgi:hypothetical protein